ncbi:MAG: tetratricopeptide repeat protein [Phycisphaerales bacterium]|nr:tetratricopeptide repeat protein [Phycisphaerales bacterium]
MGHERRGLKAMGTLALGLVVVGGGCRSLDPAYEHGSGAKATISPDRRGMAPAVSTAAAPGQAEVDRAQMFQSQGDYQRALAEFEKAIESNPTLTVAYMGAGDIYRQQGDYANAESKYSTAAQLEPANFSAQYLHGLTLHLLDRIGDAVRAYLRALTIRPEDFNANLNLATAYLQLNEPAQGLTYGERAVRIDPKSAAARANLGAIYAALNRHDDAIVEFQQAAELTPLTGPLLLNLADSLAKAGRYEEAANTLAQLIRGEPTSAAFERLGSVTFRLRRYDEALANFRRALDLDPNYYAALNGVGVCLLNQWVWSDQKDTGAKQEAIRALRKSLQIERDQPRILELIARYQ